jgi:OmpA-OmpF porin, OOP family
MSGRAPWLSGSALAVLAVMASSGPAVAQPTDPADFPDPTSSQLADSVRVWDPTGTVRVWNPDGSVSRLERQTTQGAETVLSLDTDILFAFDSAELPPTAGPAIAALLAAVPPAAAVSIVGHTDSLGDDAYNLDLSQRRADAVAGTVASARPDLALTSEGRGEAEPVAPNENGGEDNPDGRAANRRVEIRYAT